MSSEKEKKGTLNRRDFLKALSAIGGAAVISSGCSPEPLDKLVSYAVPPDDVIPGVPNYYSTALPSSPVGASIVGYQAGELINLWALALANNMKMSQIAAMVAPYPTIGEINKRAAGAYFTPRLFDSKAVKRVVGFVQRFIP